VRTLIFYRPTFFSIIFTCSSPLTGASSMVRRRTALATVLLAQQQLSLTGPSGMFRFRINIWDCESLGYSVNNSKWYVHRHLGHPTFRLPVSVNHGMPGCICFILDFWNYFHLNYVNLIFAWNVKLYRRNFYNRLILVWRNFLWLYLIPLMLSKLICSVV
jgi:hypothetical protein